MARQLFGDGFAEWANGQPLDAAEEHVVAPLDEAGRRCASLPSSGVTPRRAALHRYRLGRQQKQHLLVLLGLASATLVGAAASMFV